MRLLDINLQEKKKQDNWNTLTQGIMIGYKLGKTSLCIVTVRESFVGMNLFSSFLSNGSSFFKSFCGLLFMLMK